MAETGILPANDPAAPAARAFGQLRAWLVDRAYPLWSTAGLDRARGGFQESLNLDGTPTAAPRRARVQARQVYAFAAAPGLGWTGDAAAVSRHGLDYFRRHYRRPDGLYRSVVTPDGAPLDERAVLYDQAFALLALAESQAVLGPRPDLIDQGRRLRRALESLLQRPDGSFWSGLPDRVPLLSNPHMHLFEAFLAWVGRSDDPEWRTLADRIGILALDRLIDGRSGLLREQFDADWAPAAGLAGRLVEPGHQFEWAWLLLRWGSPQPAVSSAAALRLIRLGEAYGLRDGVAINAVLDDGSAHDAAARLWPQTEWLKATILAAERTGEPGWWRSAASAAEALQRFLDIGRPGLWRDRLGPDGRFVEEPAPASSFYHIVAAIAELARVLAAR